MDLLHNASISSSNSPLPKPSHKGEGSFVRPRADHSDAVKPSPDLNIVTDAKPQAQTNKSSQANQVIFAPSLISTTNVLDAQNSGSPRPPAGDETPPAGGEINVNNNIIDFNQEKPPIQAVQEVAPKLTQELAQEPDRENTDAKNDAQSFTQAEVKRGTNAYQAAGAVFGVGLAESIDNSGPVVFSPENISPIDIQV